MDGLRWSPPEQIRTPEKRAALSAYAAIGNVTAACVAAGIGRTTWYNWREQDPDFDQAVAEAQEAAADFLECVAVERATTGPEPSDTLLIFLLKGARPTKYRDNARIEHTGPNGGPVQVEDVTVVRDRIRNRVAKYLGEPTFG